ncbi:hypothetical protein [Brevibacterium oceani]|uniref:hypothetical protein n=1 Tax=Brevibacterium oceani TaxID=358099 RepID=UPI0015E65E42|nr:hypothetical protein [Brevibacterium oceani]
MTLTTVSAARRFLVSSIASIALIASGAVASPAAADDSNDWSADSSTDDIVRYVEADSPAEALETQEKLDKGLSAQAAGVKFGPCTLNMSNVWKRKSTGGVGSKPYTVCTQNVTSIKHKSQLAQRTALLWWKVKATRGGGNKGVKRYEQKNLSAACKSNKKSVWRASTTGTIVYKGKTYYATNMTASYKLPCRA